LNIRNPLSVKKEFADGSERRNVAASRIVAYHYLTGQPRSFAAPLY